MPDLPLALQLLQDEHASVQRLLASLRTHEGDATQIRRELCEELGRHMRLEEKIFYPTLARVKAQAPLVERLSAQHDAMRVAIGELMSLDPRETQRLDQLAGELHDLLEAHLREEEGAGFRAARSALAGELDALAVELEHCREALRGAFGVG